MLSIRLAAAVAMTALLIGCDNPEETAADHFERGVAFFEESDFDKARVELLNVLQLDETNAEAAYLLGRIEEANGDIQTAFRHYLRAADPTHAHVRAQVRVIELLAAGGRFDDAAGRATAVIGIAPDDPDLLALRATIELMRGDLARAMIDAEAALDHDARHQRATAVVATVQLDEGDPQEALDTVARVLDGSGEITDADHVALLLLRALAYQTQGDLPATIQTYSEIVELEPLTPSHRRSLAELLAQAGQLDAAEATLLEGIEAAPDLGTMNLAHVDFLTQHRGPDRAVEQLRALIDQNADDSVYDVVLANYLREIDREADAIAVLQSGRERLGSSLAAGPVNVALAAAHLRRDEGAAALALVDEVLAAEPRNVDGLLLRAAINRRGGQVDAAIRDLNSVLRSDPLNLAALQLLAESYTLAGQLQEALTTLQTLANLAPDNRPLQLDLATLLREAGRAEEADALLNEQLGLDPESAVLWRAMARTAIDLEDWEGAHAAIDRLGGLPGEEREQMRLLAELAAAQAAYPEAAAAFRQLVEEAETAGLDVPSLFAFVQTSLQAGLHQPALEFLQTIVDRGDTESVYIGSRLMAVVHGSAGDRLQAREALHQAIGVRAEAAQTYVDLARVYMVDGDPQSAREILQEGLDAGADREPLLMTLGMVHESQGNPDAALQAYGEVLDINPTSVLAANNYGSLVADASPEDSERLGEALDRLADLQTTDQPLVLDTIAWLNYRLGEYQVARALLERAGAATHENPQLRFHYGAVLMALGETEAATEILSSTVGLAFPGQDEAARLLASN